MNMKFITIELCELYCKSTDFAYSSNLMSKKLFRQQFSNDCISDITEPGSGELQKSSHMKLLIVSQGYLDREKSDSVLLNKDNKKSIIFIFTSQRHQLHVLENHDKVLRKIVTQYVCFSLQRIIETQNDLDCKGPLRIEGFRASATGIAIFH